MKHKKILICYDGSLPARRAVEEGRALGAEEPAVEFVIMTAYKLPASEEFSPEVMKAFSEENAKRLEEIQNIADAFPNNAKAVMLGGSHAPTLILRCAQEEGCDLIVMGSRGRSGMKGYLGSVSYGVVQESPIDVLVVKQPYTGEPLF